MQEHIENQFEEFENRTISRRELLPVWIKVFCWIFMIMGGISVGCLVVGAFGKPAQLSFYGFNTNEPLTFLGLFLIAIMVFKGFTAYSLWFEKDNAIKLGKIDTILGVTVCVLSMCLPFIEQNSGFSLRLEIALLIPFYLKLNKIGKEWANYVG